MVQLNYYSRLRWMKMEREYVAFISYRHKPLDMEIAEKVHKLKENK